MVLNVAALVLVGVAASSVVLGLIDDGGSAVAAPPTEAGSAVGVTPVADPPDDGRPPDIYLLVFDRYGGERTLEKTYGYDNTGFLAGLEERGFYVAHDAIGNYPNTAHSLATSLNLGYLDHLTASAGPDTGDWEPVYSMVTDNEVGRFLEDLGYRQVQIPSWWEPTRDSTTADVILSYDPLSEFSRVLLNTTAVQAAAIHLGLVEDEADPRRVEWNRCPVPARAGRRRAPRRPAGVRLRPRSPAAPSVCVRRRRQLPDGGGRGGAQPGGALRRAGRVRQRPDRVAGRRAARRARERTADHPAPIGRRAGPAAEARTPRPRPGTTPRTG